MTAIVTAHEIAIELRKVADALDREPEQVLTQGDLTFNCKFIGSTDKPTFLALARLLPRPIAKGVQSYDEDALEISHDSPALRVNAAIRRIKVCNLIEKERIIPAVYDCEPLLSALEESALTEA